jgi:hypothetical protein
MKNFILRKSPTDAGLGVITLSKTVVISKRIKNPGGVMTIEHNIKIRRTASGYALRGLLKK